MGRLYSACFLNDNNNNQIYILTSNGNDQSINYEPIKIYDLNGKKIKEINNSNEKTHFIDTYYDNNLSKYYIITGNDGYIKSYDYNNNKLYHKYLDNDNSLNLNIIINDNNKNIKLIELNNGKITDIIGHKKYVLTIKKINIPRYGDCLISQGPLDDQIKLWVIK
jgi:hypothetical protein